MNLQSPIKPKSYGLDKGLIQLTQLFSENDLDYSLLGLKGHNGWDFRTKHFQGALCPVYAAHDGVIMSEKEKQSDTAGRFIKLRSGETTYKGRICKIETVYFHLSECRHDKGTFIKKGQFIGMSGNTGGFTNGPHLHFGIYPLYPQINREFEIEENGYGGAVDPLDLMIDEQVYQCGDGMFSRKFYYNGRQILRAEVDAFIPQQYKN